jgi:hypothetical protein
MWTVLQTAASSRKALKGAGVSRLEISSPLYPEIQVLE